MKHFFRGKLPNDPNAWERDRLALLHQLLNGSSTVYNVNRGNLSRQSPLHIAADEESPADVIVCLLENGAKVNCVDSLRSSPLQKVLAYSEDLNPIANTLNLLLRHGAWLDHPIRDDDGAGSDVLQVALHNAGESGNYSIINFIFQHLSAANFRKSDSKEKYLSELVCQSYKAARYAECRVLMQHMHGVRLDFDTSRLMKLLVNDLRFAPEGLHWFRSSSA